jgi:hypothetical protein
MEKFTIDRDKKAFVFDDGEVIPIPKDKQKQVLRTKAGQQTKKKTTESLQKIQESSPYGETGEAFLGSTAQGFLGNPGATIADYLESGIKSFSPGEGQEGLGYVDRVLDHFYAMQEGRKEHLTGLQQKHPTASTIGKGVGMIGELGALGGVPATVALPIMGAGHSETSFLEPLEKGIEVGENALAGQVLDRFFGVAGRLSGARQGHRNARNAITQAEESNALELQRVGALNEAENLRFANENAAREGQISGIPSQELAQQQAFLQQGSQISDRISQTLGKTAISNEAMGVEPFISDFIDSSAYAATKEGARASKFLRTIFKGDAQGKLSGEAINKGMRALEETIVRETGPMQEILSEFRNNIVQNLPEKLGNYYTFEKWMPKITSRIIPVIESDLASTFNQSRKVLSDVQVELGRNFVVDLSNSLRANIEEVFAANASNFETALTDGLISTEIRSAIESNPSYQKLMDQLIELESFSLPQRGGGKFIAQDPSVLNIKNQIIGLPEKIANDVTQVSGKYIPDIKLDIATKSSVSENALSKLPSQPNPISQPAAVNPAQIIQPNIHPIPAIPEPQGLMQRLAYGLENLTGGGLRGTVQAAQQNAPLGIMGKMAGIPVGKMAAVAAAGTMGLNALTSPGIGGQILRSSFEQGSRGAFSFVQQLAEKYPSFHDGIIEDPQERRSLAKEIENSADMPLEEKAVFQSKINRGKPIEGKL